MNLTELSGYFREVLTFLAFFIGFVFSMILIFVHKQKRAGLFALAGFFLCIADRFLWRMISTFWLGDIYQLTRDYERIYISLEIIGAFTFLSGIVLLCLSLFMLARSNDS